MTRGQVSRRKDTRVRSVRRLTAGFFHHGAPVWSPGGQLLGFTLGRGADSHWLLTDRKGRAARVLEGPVVGGASLAADHRVAYGRQVGATAEIWLLAELEAPPRRLLGGDGRLYRDPAFSPDGRHLCYAADDGLDAEESPLRLWVVDLARVDHTLLVAEPPTLAGATGPVRAGHPAWSSDGAWIFFEVAQGESRAIALVEVESRKVHLLTGPGFGRPAPIAPGVLAVERVAADQLGEICLLHYRTPHPQAQHPEAAVPALDFKVRTTPIAGIPPGSREPAVAVSKKGVVRIAWTAPGRTKGGEPQRYDVHRGQLACLPKGRSPRPLVEPSAPVRPEADPDPDRGSEQSAVAVAGVVSNAATPPEASAPETKSRDKAKAKTKKAAKADRARAAALDDAGDGKNQRAGRAGDGAAGDEAPADAERGV